MHKTDCEEIQQAMAKLGELDYDALANLPYLDAVCRETLRLYPPVTMVARTYVPPRFRQGMMAHICARSLCPKTRMLSCQS